MVKISVFLDSEKIHTCNSKYQGFHKGDFIEIGKVCFTIIDVCYSFTHNEIQVGVEEQ